MSTFIRRYSRYLNEKAFSYRQMAFDFARVKKGYGSHSFFLICLSTVNPLGIRELFNQACMPASTDPGRPGSHSPGETS